MIEEFFYPVGDENLHGISYKTDPDAIPKLIFLHGAGTGNKDRRTYLHKLLLERNVSSFAFDFSGHGKSSGELSKSSLKKRVVEARRSIDLHMNTNEPISICASSMGAHIAVELLAFYNIKSLILMAPAVYGKEAFEIQFDQGFTEVIRKKESWKSASTMELLKKFNGNFYLYIGENDNVIPQEVIGMLNENATKSASFRLIRLDGAPHELHSWIEKDEPLSFRIADEISSIA